MTAPAPTTSPATPAPAAGTAVAQRTPTRMDTLRGTLLRPQVIAGLKEVLPKFLTPERVVRVALAAASRTPLLLECKPESILRSIMQGAQLGLEPGSAIGGAYLVPYKRNKKIRGEWESTYEAQLIVGYRGYIDLARRSGEVLSIAAYVIHANDKYDIDYGRVEAPVQHRPTIIGDPGPIIGVWAVARLVGGGLQVDFMTRAEVDAIRDRSQAKDSGPWVTDYSEMARKTVVRRIAKYLPLSTEKARGLALAAALEDRAEAGETSNDLFDIDMKKVMPDAAPEDDADADAGETPAIPPAKEDQLAASLAAKRAARTPAPVQAAPPAAAPAPAASTPATPAAAPADDGPDPDAVYQKLAETAISQVSVTSLEDFPARHKGEIDALPADLQVKLGELVKGLVKGLKLKADVAAKGTNAAPKRKKAEQPALPSEPAAPAKAETPAPVAAQSDRDLDSSTEGDGEEY